MGGSPHQTQSLPGSGIQLPELGVSTGLFDGSSLCCSVMAAGLVEAALPASPGPSTLKMQEARLDVRDRIFLSQCPPTASPFLCPFVSRRVSAEVSDSILLFISRNWWEMNKQAAKLTRRLSPAGSSVIKNHPI